MVTGVFTKELQTPQTTLSKCILPQAAEPSIRLKPQKIDRCRSVIRLAKNRSQMDSFFLVHDTGFSGLQILYSFLQRCNLLFQAFNDLRFFWPFITHGNLPITLFRAIPRAIPGTPAIPGTLFRGYSGVIPGTPYLILHFWPGFLGFQLSPKKVFQLIYKLAVSTGTASSFMFLEQSLIFVICIYR